MVATAARPITSSVGWDKDWNRTYTSVYEVITTDVQDGPITAVQASGIPAYRSPYSWGNDSDPWAFCSEVDAQIRSVEETSKLWTVTVTHTTRPQFRCADTQIENPLDEPLKLSGSFVQFQRPTQVDKDGNPIVNSVDEPFVPAIERDDSHDTLNVEFNSPTIDLQLRAEFRDAINSQGLWGLLRWTVKLTQWDWAIAYYGTCNAYVINRMTFLIKYGTGVDSTWIKEVLDAGFRHKINCAVGLDPALRMKTNTDAQDNQIHQPMPLDGSGNPISIACGDAPVYLSWHLYNEKNFADLGLPDPLPGPFTLRQLI